MILKRLTFQTNTNIPEPNTGKTLSKAKIEVEIAPGNKLMWTCGFERHPEVHSLYGIQRVNTKIRTKLANWKGSPRNGIMKWKRKCGKKEMVGTLDAGLCIYALLCHLSVLRDFLA